MEFNNKKDKDLIITENFDEVIDEISEEKYDIEIMDDDFGDDYSENYDIDKIPTKEEKFNLLYHLNTNKHKQEGKHRLKRDTIFKGKLEKKTDEDIYGYNVDLNDYNDISSFFTYESEEHSNNLEQNNLTKDVYEILDTKTELDFKQNRRKPNKETFNNFYNLLIKELGFRYTKSEIFVELSFYFTDNIFNMFKLLHKNPATIIIKELRQKGFLKDLDGINFL